MTIPKNDAIEARLTSQDLLATYYAWGRLDQGHKAIVGTSPESRNTSETAWRFGVLYRAMQSAMAYEITCYAHGVETAWRNFVDSDGESVLGERDRACDHTREPRGWDGKVWCSYCGAEVPPLNSPAREAVAANA